MPLVGADPLSSSLSTPVRRFTGVNDMDVGQKASGEDYASGQTPGTADGTNLGGCCSSLRRGPRGRRPNRIGGVWIQGLESCRRRHRWCGNCGPAVEGEVRGGFGCGPRLCSKPDCPWIAVDGSPQSFLRPPWNTPVSTRRGPSSTVVHRDVHRCEHSSHGCFRLGMRVGRRSGGVGMPSGDGAVTTCTVCPITDRSAGQRSTWAERVTGFT